MEGQPIKVLLVEDNLADRKLTIKTLELSKLSLDIDWVKDGEEAMDYLKKRGAFANKKKPDIVLLDLNMPKLDGREVLKRIREDSDLKSLPVVILTTSSSEEDILKSYELNANSFITKPVDLDEFKKIVKSMTDFWFSIVKLPPNN